MLRLLNGASRLRIVDQAIDRGRFGEGTSAEHVAAIIPPGESAQFGYAMPRAPVIEELRLAAWVWCNRPGAQLAALVELPRSTDPETGARLSLLIRSDAPAAGDGWRQLTLADLPAGLAAQTRVARAQQRADIDERGAYVTHLVILGPGGPGITEMWVDQISIHGALRGTPATDSAVKLAAATDSPTNIQPQGATPPMVSTADQQRPPPLVPRILQWQGEPFELAARLGFDAVALGRTPSAEELVEARRTGLFIVSPPPPPEAIEAHGLGAEFEPVMAWDMGEFGSGGDQPAVQRWAESIRRHDSNQSRPMLLRPGATPLAASRVADLLLLQRPMLDSTLSWPEYAAWLTHQRRLARPGTGLWMSVETHSSNNRLAQLAAVRGGQPAIVPANIAELTTTCTATLGALPRGFYFESQRSLADADPQSRRRALALELTNLRLGLVEPWLASGKPATAARSSRPEVTAMVLTVERSRLIVPVQWGQAATGGGEPLSFVLPGVPESCDAYLLSVAGPRRLETRRVTGGLRVLVDQLPPDSFVLLTEDGYAFSQVERYLRQYAARAAQVRLELAALARRQAAEALATLPGAVVQDADAARLLAGADAEMTNVNRTLETRDYASAYASAAAAHDLIDELHYRLAATIWPEGRLGAPPLPLDWSTLPDLLRLAAAVDRADQPSQLFPGGDFEDLNSLVASGWQRREGEADGIRTAIRLSPTSPGEGGGCLELEVRQADGSATAIPALASAPTWITSPPIEIPAGCALEITGLARVDDAPIGSGDPLVIFDSIGGEESAVRIAEAPTWTPFRMVRAAPSGATCQVTVALGGVGTAQVDSLRYRPIPLATPRAIVVQNPPGTVLR